MILLFWDTNFDPLINGSPWAWNSWRRTALPEALPGSHNNTFKNDTTVCLFFFFFFWEQTQRQHSVRGLCFKSRHALLCNYFSYYEDDTSFDSTLLTSGINRLSLVYSNRRELLGRFDTTEGESEWNPKTAGQEKNMTIGTREKVKNQKVHWTTKLENGGKKMGIE